MDRSQTDLLFTTYQRWYVIVSLEFFDTTGKNIQDGILRQQRRTHNEDSSWRCDCVHVVSRRRGSRWAAVMQQRWPGKSASFPSILQRQWDVRGRWPFPANQREERTPPSTSAQTAMRFPCLCWLMEVWRYLYPFWQKTGIQREELQSLIGQDCLSSSNVWVNLFTVSDVWVVKV